MKKIPEALLAKINLFLKKYAIILLLGIVFDFGSMTANEVMKQKSIQYGNQFHPINCSQEQRNYVYFSGQSLSRLFYIWAIVIYSSCFFVPHLIALSWLWFAANDSIQELFFDNTEFDITEYIFLFLAIVSVLYSLRKHYKT